MHRELDTSGLLGTAIDLWKEQVRIDVCLRYDAFTVAVSLISTAIKFRGILPPVSKHASKTWYEDLFDVPHASVHDFMGSIVGALSIVPTDGGCSHETAHLVA
jgi:hypothetical protein